MLMSVEWGSTQWYVVLTVLAAAFVAVCARPREKGRAYEKLLSGEHVDCPLSDEPVLNVKVTEGNHVIFTRRGLDGLTSSGAMSFVVRRIGFDLSIIERVSQGFPNDQPLSGISLEIDFLAPDEFYHVHWKNEETGLWVAFTLHVKPGIDFQRELKR